MRRGLLVAVGLLVLAISFFGVRSVTRQQAGAAVDQGIDQLLTQLPPGYAVKHGVTDVNPLTSAVTVHNVTVTRDGAPVMFADALTIAGADQRALQDVFDPSAYPQGRPAWTDRRLLIADAMASSVQLPARPPQTGMVTVRSISWHRLSGRPFMLPPTPEHRADPRFQADAALAFSLDSASIHDVSVAVQGLKPGTGSLASVTFSDYDAGRLGSAALKQLTLHAPAKTGGKTVDFVLDRVDLKNVDARALLEAVQRTGSAGPVAFGTASYAAADLAGLAVHVPDGPDIAMNDLHLEQGALAEGASRRGHASMHGLVVALGQSQVPASARAALDAFGTTSLALDIDATGISDAAAGTTDVIEDITLRNLGTMHIKADLGGLNQAADQPAAPPGHPEGALTSVVVKQASLVWDDASLTNRVMAVAAAQMHTTPDLVRAQLAMPVISLGLMMPDQPDAADQVTKFLTNPHRLSITMNPPQKISIGEVSAAPINARAHLLGMHIRAD